jgi:large subunit ribosomal protein L24
MKTAAKKQATKLRIKKDDRVKVIAGDDKGKEGRILRVYPETSRVLVEGLNMVTKHNKPTAQNTSGSISKKEAPIHISNVMLIDNGGKPTRVGKQKDDKGKSVRVSKKSGEVIK